MGYFFAKLYSISCSLVGEEYVRFGYFMEDTERKLFLVRQCAVGKQGSVC